MIKVQQVQLSDTFHLYYGSMVIMVEV